MPGPLSCWAAIFATEDPTWNFVFATLSSSAFPAVFAPRQEADVLPGTGRVDRLFADGGMFDNLPFFPAIEILEAGQNTPKPGEQRTAASVLSRVRERAKHRDIFIAAGLNAAPEAASTYDTFFKIQSRAGELSVESKVKTFLSGAKKVQQALEEIGSAKDLELTDNDAGYLETTVNGAILKIDPTDRNHINGTFAFCRSTGMKVGTIQNSIADGCFQSLGAFL